VLAQNRLIYNKKEIPVQSVTSIPFAFTNSQNTIFGKTELQIFAHLATTRKMGWGYWFTVGGVSV